MKYSGLIVKDSTNASAVKALKNQLNLRINAGLNIDNPTFGESTQKAVIAFQKANNLNPDGDVGSLTWERLFSPVIPHLIDSPILRIRAEQILFTQLHVRELTGNNDGVEVEMYLKSVGLGKGYPWCVAVQFWAFQLAALQLNIKNPMPKTAGVLDCLKKSKAYVLDLSKESPQAGDIGCMDFGGGKGHMYMVTANRIKNVFSIEGNTSADPAYKAMDRDGNGMFERNRLISSTKDFIRYV